MLKRIRARLWLQTAAVALQPFAAMAFGVA